MRLPLAFLILPLVAALFTTSAAAQTPAPPRGPWYKVADEGQKVAVAAGAHVRFGTPQQWVTKTAAGSMTCDNATFAIDPNPGVFKQCQSDDAAFRNTDVKLMLIGDSITGFYREYLYHAIQAGGFKHVDFVGNAMYGYHHAGEPDPDSNGYGGYMSTWLLLPPGGNWRTNVAGHDNPNCSYACGDSRDVANWFLGQAPDIVLLEIGTNDGGGAIDAATTAKMTSDLLLSYTRVLAAARATNPKVRFFVAQLTPQAAGPGNDFMTAFNPSVPGWAAANTTAASPVTVVDQNTGFSGEVSTTVIGTRDTVHPNELMGKAMAQRWYAAIKPFLDPAAVTAHAVRATSATTGVPAAATAKVHSPSRADGTACSAAALATSADPARYTCAPTTIRPVSEVVPHPAIAAPPVPIKLPVAGVMSMTHGGLDIDPRVITPPAVGTGELRLMKVTGIAPNASQGGAFRTFCLEAKMGFFDPIVYPGQDVKSHLHTFFGNVGIDANTTPESLRTTGNTTCTGGISNRSAYWTPTMIDMATGRPVPNGGIGVYYKAGQIASSLIQPIPVGLRMIAGNPMRKPGDDPVGFRYACIGGPKEQNDHYGPNIPDCDLGATIMQQIDFPQCWDGVNLDSPDHQSHMAYPTTLFGPQGQQSYVCNAAHPVPLPHISFNIGYVQTVAHGSAKWRVASDSYDATQSGGWSTHGDWFNGWIKEVSDTWSKKCVQEEKDCHSFLLGDGRMQF